MYSDFLYTLRSLSRAKMYSLVVIVTLAIGIGSAAAIFSVTDWILFRPKSLPADAYMIGTRNPDGSFMPVNPPARFESCRSADIFSEIAAMTSQAGNLVVNGQPLPDPVGGVTRGFFSIIGARPKLGRGFNEMDETEGVQAIAVVTDQFWRNALNARPDVIGSEFVFDQKIYRIVGVLGKDQVFPLMLQRAAYVLAEMPRPEPEQPWKNMLWLVGKLKPGMPVATAEKLLATAPMNVTAQYAQMFRDNKCAFRKLGDTQDFFHAENYVLLLCAVALLYAIACLNSANLILLRMVGRRRDLSIRLSLGGSAWAVFRIFLLETFTLCTLAGAVGILVAHWLFPILFRLAQGSGGVGIGLDPRTLLVLVGLTFVSGGVILVVPLLRVFKLDLQSALRDGGAALGESRRLRRLRGALIAVQAAFAVVLVSGAALLHSTMARLAEVEVGYARDYRAEAQMYFRDFMHGTKEERLNYLKQIQTLLRRVPGIEDVAYSSLIPLVGWAYPANSHYRARDGAEVTTELHYLSANFCEVTGAKLIRGHLLDEHSPGNEIVVNEAFVRRCFKGRDPIDQSIVNIDEKPPKDAGGLRIVGVISDLRYGPRLDPAPQVFAPESWFPYQMNTLSFRLTREADPKLDMVIRRALYDFDPTLVVNPITSFNQMVRNSIWAEQFSRAIFQVLAILALVLAAVGIFTALTYSVDRRMSEFGVRLALGATPGSLAGLVAKQAVVLVGAGVLVGIGAAVALSRYLHSLLYGISPHNPWVYVSAAVILIGAALLASWWPARCAKRADAAQLLRAE